MGTTNSLQLLSYPHYNKSGERRATLVPDSMFSIFTQTKDNGTIFVKFTQHYSMLCGKYLIFSVSSDFPGFCITIENLRPARPLPAAKNAWDHWAEQLQELVEAFHKAGYVHGELQDTNIMYKGERAFLIGLGRHRTPWI